MLSIDLSAATWQKSSYSNQDGGACVEVVAGLDAVVPVRDSKVGSEQVLVFPEEPWSAFLRTLKHP